MTNLICFLVSRGMKGCIRRRNLLKKQTLYQKSDKTSISFFPILIRFRKSPYVSRGGLRKMAYTIRDNVGLRRQRGTFFRFSAVPDPGLMIRWRGGRSPKNFFRPFFLRASLWSKMKGGPGPPGPLSWIRHCPVIWKCKDFTSWSILKGRKICHFRM